MSDPASQEKNTRCLRSGEPVDTGPAAGVRKRAAFKNKWSVYWALFALLMYAVGLSNGYLFWGGASMGTRTVNGKADSGEPDELSSLLEQVNPAEGYDLHVHYGDFAPRLVAAGAIDYPQFVKLYEDGGSPLSEEQTELLTQGSDASILINRENQHFLLNLFWALGLANQNKILTEGPMMRDGADKVLNFASTGGWTLAARPVAEVYASQPILVLTDAQQKRLEEVAAGVYRPCCDNPTHFPDCNHGMAMLGLLELMASQDASVKEMFAAAKYVNAFWFPQQAVEVALLFKSGKFVDFAHADSAEVVGQSIFSGSGFRAVHNLLVQQGKIDQASQGGGSCGVQ